MGREPQYEAFADGFAEHAEHSLWNAAYDRPACLALLGDVRGLDVLDAACGPGLYAEELVRLGARVTALDQSPRMVELTRARVPAATVRVADLADPLAWLADASVDAVLLALAYHYIDDRVAVLRELRRVLRPDGALVMSTTHPTSDWLRLGGSYFEARVVEEVWDPGWLVRSWVMPLGTVVDELHRAGFLVERLVEPRPEPWARDRDPDDYDRLQREPGFLAIRAIPDPR